MYSWQDVAERTVVVYNNVLQQRPVPLVERFRRFFGAGVFFGWIAVGIVALLHLLWCVLKHTCPASEIELAVDFPHASYHDQHISMHQEYQRLGPDATSGASAGPPKDAVAIAAGRGRQGRGGSVRSLGSRGGRTADGSQLSRGGGGSGAALIRFQSSDHASDLALLDRITTAHRTSSATELGRVTHDRTELPQSQSYPTGATTAPSTARAIASPPRPARQQQQ